MDNIILGIIRLSRDANFSQTKLIFLAIALDSKPSMLTIMAKYNDHAKLVMKNSNIKPVVITKTVLTGSYVSFLPIIRRYYK